MGLKLQSVCSYPRNLILWSIIGSTNTIQQTIDVSATQTPANKCTIYFCNWHCHLTVIPFNANIHTENQ
jgi:hypothetical protein